MAYRWQLVWLRQEVPGMTSAGLIVSRALFDFQHCSVGYECKFMLTFTLIFDLIDPPGFVKFSREGQKNPARYRGTRQNEISGLKRIRVSLVPVSVIHHALLELHEQRLKLLFGQGHIAVKWWGTERDAKRERS
jgi:hypothetical protein